MPGMGLSPNTGNSRKEVPGRNKIDPEGQGKERMSGPPAMPEVRLIFSERSGSLWLNLVPV
jgi:hypothetical protein